MDWIMGALIASVTLSLSFTIDLCWCYVKPLLRQPFLSLSLIIVRVAHAFSWLGLGVCAINYLAAIDVRNIFQVLPIVAICVGNVAMMIAVTIMTRRGAAASMEELVEKEKLKDEIRAEVKKEVNSIVNGGVQRMEEIIWELKEDGIKRIESVESKINNMSALVIKDHEQLGGAMKNIDGLVRGYRSLVEEYWEEGRKRELLNLQIEEVARLAEEWRRRVEALPTAPAEVMPEGHAEKGTLLTRANGLASRIKGEHAQRETADILRRDGFQVEEYYGLGQPDFILKLSGMRVAVGAHKAFTLSRDGMRQRTIAANDIRAEINVALKWNLPLAIFITNLSNGRRWAELISRDKVKEFQRYTTPLILIDDSPEAERICEESIAKLKEIIKYTTT